MSQARLRRLVVYRGLDAFASALHAFAMQSESRPAVEALSRSAQEFGISRIAHVHLHRCAWSLFHDSYRLLQRHGAALHGMWDVVEGRNGPDSGLVKTASRAPAFSTPGDRLPVHVYEALCGPDIAVLNRHLGALNAEDDESGWRGRLGAELFAEALDRTVTPDGADRPCILYLAVLHARILQVMLPCLSHLLASGERS